MPGATIFLRAVARCLTNREKAIGTNQFVAHFRPVAAIGVFPIITLNSRYALSDVCERTEKRHIKSFPAKKLRHFKQKAIQPCGSGSRIFLMPSPRCWAGCGSRFGTG